MPYLTPSGGQPATIPRRSKAATDTFRASRDPSHTTRPAHYLPSTLKPLTNSNASSSSGSPAGGPSGVGSASGRPRSRSDLTPRPSSATASHHLEEGSSQGGPDADAHADADEDGVGQITGGIAGASLADSPSTTTAALDKEDSHTRRDSTPSLSSHAASASSVSVASLGQGSDNDQDNTTTPATSAGVSHSNSTDGAVVMTTGASREDRDEAVRRYMHELYAFHRRLYEEAKHEAEGGAPRKGSFSQFGERQSGMAKLAAKKALASKLNA